MSSPRTSKAREMPHATLLALILVMGHVSLVVEALSPVNDIIITSSQAKEFEERERLKDEVAKEVLEVLYTLFRQGNGNTGGNQRPASPSGGGLRGFAGANGQALQDYPSFLRAGGESSLPSGFMKKSMSESKQKQIRFHQCYFNPISCFR